MARTHIDASTKTRRIVTPHVKTFHYVSFVPVGTSGKTVLVYGTATVARTAELRAWKNLRAVDSTASRDSLVTRLAAHSVVERAGDDMKTGARVRVSVGRNGRVSLSSRA